MGICTLGTVTRIFVAKLLYPFTVFRSMSDAQAAPAHLELVDACFEVVVLPSLLQLRAVIHSMAGVGYAFFVAPKAFVGHSKVYYLLLLFILRVIR